MNRPSPTANLITLIAVLIGMLIISIGAKGQTPGFQLTFAKVEKGKLKIIHTRRYTSMMEAENQRVRLAKHLRKNEVLVGPAWVEETTVTITEISESPWRLKP